MSVRKGNKIIAGSHSYRPDLLDWKWADHILDNMSWLRGDTFSWQDGKVYEAVYEHLYNEWASGYTIETDVVAGHTLSYRRAADGHKIVPAAYEHVVAAIYAATGVAWYYIIDTVNQKFKLPRAKHNKYANNLSVVGNGMTMAFTNGDVERVISASAGSGGYVDAMWGANGVGQSVSTSNLGTLATNGTWGLTPNAQHSGVIAQEEEERDQYKYLYFYVGRFTQTALENTAGLNAELFNDKVDVGHELIAFQAPTVQNNYTWYRKYADGWVEQGGAFPTSVDSAVTITLPLSMADSNYTLQLTRTFSAQNTTTANNGGIATWNKTTISFMCWGKYFDTVTDNWMVCGMGA